MAHPFNVPASAVLPRVAAELKTRQLVNPPPWPAFVKDRGSRQQAPTQTDWRYLRSASVLRKSHERPDAASSGFRPITADEDRGSAPYHARTGSAPSFARSSSSSRSPASSRRRRTRVARSALRACSFSTRRRARRSRAGRDAPRTRQVHLNRTGWRIRGSRMAYDADPELAELRKRRLREIETMQATGMPGARPTRPSRPRRTVVNRSVPRHFGAS